MAPSSARNPILQEPAPPSWLKPPSSLTEILKTASYCPSGSCPCPKPGGQMNYFETRVRSHWSFAQSPPALHHTSVKVNPHCSPPALQDLPPTLLWPHALHHWAPATLPSTHLHLPHACHRAFALPRCSSPNAQCSLSPFPQVLAQM